MSALDDAFGTMLIGAIIAAMSFGILSVQTGWYFHNYPNDHRYVKMTVCAVWIITLLHLVPVVSFPYIYTVGHYFDPAFLVVNNWTIPMIVLGEAFAALLVQMFYAHRLSRLNPELRIISYITVISGLANFAFGNALTGVVWGLPLFSDFITTPKRWMVVAWLALGLFTDILVTTPMVWTLYTSRTGFRPTDRMLGRLMIWSVHTAGLTTVVAALDLIFFMQSTKTLIHLTFNITLAGLYGNTLLATLNRRTKFTQEGGGTGEYALNQKNSDIIHLSRFDPKKSMPSAGLPAPQIQISQNVVTMGDAMGNVDGDVESFSFDRK